jgi:hypothetical protein
MEYVIRLNLHKGFRMGEIECNVSWAFCPGIADEHCGSRVMPPGASCVCDSSKKQTNESSNSPHSTEAHLLRACGLVSREM